MCITLCASSTEPERWRGRGSGADVMRHVAARHGLKGTAQPVNAQVLHEVIRTVAG